MDRMPIDTPKRETIRESHEMLSSHKEIQVAEYQANTNYPNVTGNATATILAGGIVNAVSVRWESKRTQSSFIFWA
jgi:hypothetical protein